MRAFPCAAVLAVALTAASAAAGRAAPTWEAEVGARAVEMSASLTAALRKSAGDLPGLAGHRVLGGGEGLPQFEDEIQREARELMKTVRPRGEWKKGEPIGRFLDTYYFNVVESDYSGPQTVTVKDGKGKVLAKVRQGFWEHFNVEGTGRILDGRELNTSEHGTIVVDAPMGEGTCRLEAWRVMAVDPRVIPLGTFVRIDETVGLKLADGTVLDGYWRAEDTGGEVRNAHVDLYVGDGEKGGLVLENAGIHLKGLTVRYVDTPPTTCAKP
jgi:hypothetical protein